jgi:hypothetical protein
MNTTQLAPGRAETQRAARNYSSFFTCLDLNRPGLEKVRSAVQAGALDTAAEELLRYYRTRTGVAYYEGWQNRQLRPDYDTTKADEICANRLVGRDLSEHIDWHADPHGDPEWKYCLHRHEYLTELGRAYWYTGNEKYTLAWKRILGDWIRENPMPDLERMLQLPSEASRMRFMRSGNWRPLTLGIRIYTAFVPCFHHFLNSTEFTPDFLVTMLTSMVEHARHLRLYYTRHKSYFNVSPNWGLMESNGLAHMGILFPEFKDAADWTGEATSRLEEQIRMQVLPDGMQVERASGYHLVSTFCFLQILDLAQRNNIRVSDTYRRTAERMAQFVMSVMKPHGVYPMLKDGDESDVFGARASHGLWEDIKNLNMLEDSNDLRWVLKTAAKMFRRQDMLYVATHGREGELPELGSIGMPDAGFFVMRTGWKPDDLYMVFTCGELGVMDQNCVHGNADALSFDISGYGSTLLIDPGRYLYEGPWRVWFKSTKAHNTIAVDGQDSSELADEWMFKTKTRSVLHCWSTTERFDYVDGRHEGYHRLHDPVTHRRRILFVKPYFWLVVDELTAADGHTYDQYFHFAEGAELSSGESHAFIARYPNRAGILVKPLFTDGLRAETYLGSTDPIQGWVSYDYAVKVPAHTLRYSRETDRGARFVTLLAPFQGQPDAFEIAPCGDLAFRVANGTDSWHIAFGDGVHTTSGEFEFDGEALCAKFDRTGTLADLFGARTSMIRHRGKLLLDSVQRVKVDADGGFHVQA